jgi:hypothetical protein
LMLSMGIHKRFGGPILVGKTIKLFTFRRAFTRNVKVLLVFVR